MTRDEAIFVLEHTETIVPVIEEAVQVAIDALKQPDMLKRLLEERPSVPPEQPEITRCKDCEWFNDIGCAIRIVDDTDKPSENDYCSFAERESMDPIDRQMAIEAVVAWTVEDRPDIEMPTDLVGRINALPSAWPEHSEGLYVDGFNDGYRERMSDEPQWIPCNWHKDTESLPDECKSVLICIKDKIGMYVDVSYRTDYNRWERYGRNVNVVAWRELPEPWRGEDDAQQDCP